MLSIGMSEGTVQWRPYSVTSLIVHLGPTPVSGHCPLWCCVLQRGHMSITDDNVRATKVDRVKERASLVVLCSSQ